MMQREPVGDIMSMELEQNVSREIEELGEESDESDISKRIIPWKKQITLRGLIASVVIGCIYSVIAMKLTLTTGLTPNMNVSAALIAYIFIGSWTKLLGKAGIVTIPFTRQENTMIQTCAVACYSIAVQGGLGSYLLGLSKKIYEQTGVDTPGNSPGSYKDPGLGWMIGFLCLVSFIGLFVLIPFRKVFIIDYKLTFPTGMATGVLINGFHNQAWERMARKQVQGFLKIFSVSFLWGLFQWLYTGKGGGCGFSYFPTFGMKAFKNTFYFDFSLTYVGAGMICPHNVNLSALLGAVISWGVMWPLMEKLKGQWFPADIPETSMKSLNGYKVFIPIALLLGDGLYSFTKLFVVIILNARFKFKQRNISVVDESTQSQSLDDIQKSEIFVRESIPLWLGATGYILLALITTIAIPFMFPEFKWYYVIAAYVLAPALAFCNSYGAGVTDINMAYNYSKLGLFAMAGLAGRQHGVVAGLAACGLIKSIVCMSCVLMQDLKTGYLTLTSPRAMLLSQAIGTAIGCIVSPLCFFLFYRAFDVGNPNGEYRAPLALIYRNMAILGVEGFSALPHNCLQLCCVFFAFAVGVNLVKDFSPKKIGKWMPMPSAMAVPFLVGAFFSIDMCLGSLIVFVWHKLDSRMAGVMVPAIASGLMCGEGLWSLPESVLSLAKINPPMCMKVMAS